MATYEEFIQNILKTRGRFNCGDEYHERHHIVPKCVGGTNEENNLVDLFAREHFDAHRLLALENPNNKKLVFAWHMMSVNGHLKERYTLTADEYEELRKAMTSALKGLNNGRKLTQEQRMAMSERLKGIPKSDAHKKKIGLSHIGIKPSEETKKKLAEWQVGDKSPKAKRIIQYDLNCSYIREWGCIKDASDVTGITRSSINRCCQKDKWYKQAGGFIWRYADDMITEDEATKIIIEMQRVRGVYQEKNGKWFAKVGNKRIGTYLTKEDAVEAKLKAQKQLSEIINDN